MSGRGYRTLIALGLALGVSLFAPERVPVGPSSAQAGCGSIGSNPTPVTFTFEGEPRRYVEYVPESLPAGPVPLVIALHGGGSGDVASATCTGLSPDRPMSHWNEIADDEGFIVVYPRGLASMGVGFHWNDCRADSNVTGSANDVGFIEAVIDRVSSEHEIDQSRVHASGPSNGGLMSYRLASELTHRLAGIGAVIANNAAVSECSEPELPITVVIVNGDADPAMPWDGGCVLNDCGRGTVVSTQETLEFWIAHNGANAEPDEVLEYPDSFANDGPSTVARYLHRGGHEGTEVVLYRVFGGGHADPSTHHRIGLVEQAQTGPQNGDLEATEAIWSILKEHSRPDDGFAALAEDLAPSPAAGEGEEEPAPQAVRAPSGFPDADSEPRSTLPVTGGGMGGLAGALLVVAALAARRVLFRPRR